MRKFAVGLIVYLGTLFVLSSCVQTDFYEYYDDDDSLETFIPRQKKSKDIYNTTYNCGVCCVAYVINGQDPDIGSALETVARKCDKLDLSYGADYSLTGEELETLVEACSGESWTRLSWDAIVDGEKVPNYYASQMETAFQSMGSYPMIINTGDGHWIVGKEYLSQKTRWGKTIDCTEVDCYDPQHGKGYGTIDIHDIPYIIYRE